ncbi:MAG: hypothetical protein KC912_04775 [Proteobacteria bacterium]|nr:hypothetical protein [Pseudomonadota bacterium]
MQRLPLLFLLAACAGTEPEDPVSFDITAPGVATIPADSATSSESIQGIVEVESTGVAGIEYEYSWLSDGGLSWAEQDLPASATTRGETWTLTVIPFAGDTAGPGATASVAVVNSPPTLTAVFSPSTPTVGQDLSCQAESVADADEDEVTLAYTWQIEGSDIALTTDTLPATQVVSQSQITCIIIANDGEASVEARVSSSADNSPPAVGTVAISPDPAISTQDLACVPSGASDPDGDAVVFTYTWTVNNTPLSVTANALTADNYVRGDNVTCTATPSDGVASGVAVESNPVIIGNASPTVDDVVLSPLDPFSTDTLSCTPRSTDPDNDTLTHTYRWFLNGNLLGETSDALAPGAFRFQDNIACEATVNDGLASAVGTSQTAVVQNTPPIVTGVSISPNPADATNSLQCSHTDTSDVDGDSVSVTYAWTVNGSTAGAGSTLAPGSAVRDQTVQCHATPNDGAVDGVAVVASMVMINAAPGMPELSASPAAPTASDAITCSATASDPDNDTLSWTYEWFIGTTSVANGAVLPAGTVQSNQVARCEATPNDGLADGPTGTLTVALGNQLPVIDSVVIGPTAPVAGDIMTCTATASDPDTSDTLTYSYTWLVNGNDVGVDSDFLTPADIGIKYSDNVQCSVTVADGISEVSSSSATVVVDNTPPTLTGAAITPSSADTTQSLTCTGLGSADADGQSVNVTYAWTVAGSAAGTGSSLASGVARKGQDVSCTVTPNDGVDSGTARTANLTVGNATPGVPSVQVGPVGATSADSLNCQAIASDPDGDSLSYDYTWTISGATVGTGSTLASGVVSPGDVVACEVRADDGDASGPVGSASLTIANEPPVIGTVTLSTTSPATGDDIVCSTTASDPDGDDVTISYTWYINNSPISGNTDTLSSGFTYGDTVECRATASDGADSASRTSATATVINTRPSVSGVSVSPGTATAAQALTCSYGSLTDPDTNQSPTVRYEWKIGNATVGSSAVLPAFTATRGDTATCNVTPNDGVTDGTTRSASRDIQNSVPSTPSVSITPSSPTAADALTCTGVATDDDPADNLNYSYAWYIGTTRIGTTNTLAGGTANGGDTVRCEVSASDGTISGPKGSASVTLDAPPNSPPTVTSASISPNGNLYETSTLTCTANGVSDPDGDDITIAYQWTKGGTAISGATSRTLTGASFSKNDVIACRVTPNDGTTNGSSRTSSTVTIKNTLPTLASAGLSPGSAYETSTFSCSAGATSDADGDTVGLKYRWTDNNSTISGATSSTLTGASFSKGSPIQCHVTPNDGDADGTTESSATITVLNSKPSITSASVSPGTAYETTTLTCLGGVTSDPDGDTVTKRYTWRNGTTTIANQTSSTLTGSSFRKDDDISCTITPWDGTTTGTTRTSSAVTIKNTKPTLASASITPDDAAYENTTFTCSGSSTNDVDGDSVSLLYAWTIRGSTIIGANESTLTGTDFDKHDEVGCVVTPFDGDENGTPRASTTVDVLNSLPSSPRLILFPGMELEDLFCVIDRPSLDMDNDPISYEFTWFQNGAPYTSALMSNEWPNDTVPGFRVRMGTEFECHAQPFDQEDYGFPGMAFIFIDGFGKPRLSASPDSGHKPRTVRLLGWRLAETAELGVDPTLDGDCSVHYAVERHVPDLDTWEPIWQADSFDTTVELAGAFAIHDDEDYRVSFASEGCPDELFELSVDGEWFEGQQR